MAATLGAAWAVEKIRAAQTKVKSTQLFQPQGISGTAWNVFRTGGISQLLFVGSSLLVKSDTQGNLVIDINPTSIPPPTGSGFKTIKKLVFDPVSMSWEVGENIPAIHQLFCQGILYESGNGNDYNVNGTKIIPLEDTLKDSTAKVIIYY